MPSLILGVEDISDLVKYHCEEGEVEEEDRVGGLEGV